MKSVRSGVVTLFLIAFVAMGFATVTPIWGQDLLECSEPSSDVFGTVSDDIDIDEELKKEREEQNPAPSGHVDVTKNDERSEPETHKPESESINCPEVTPEKIIDPKSQTPAPGTRTPAQ